MEVQIPELEGLSSVRAGPKNFRLKEISAYVPNSDYSVSLRVGTSDIPTFYQIFAHDEYDSAVLPASADVIFDIGANIGLSAVFFGLRYPSAKILALEPDAENFAMLRRNVQSLANGVQLEEAALWPSDGSIYLHEQSDSGHDLGAWGRQVSERETPKAKRTKSVTMQTLLDANGISCVDILKVDIEGAELEVFSMDSAGWLERVRLIVVETHDRFRPGSDAAVRNALRPNFNELPRKGENMFFRHKSL